MGCDESDHYTGIDFSARIARTACRMHQLSSPYNIRAVLLYVCCKVRNEVGQSATHDGGYQFHCLKKYHWAGSNPALTEAYCMLLGNLRQDTFETRGIAVHSHFQISAI